MKPKLPFILLAVLTAASAALADDGDLKKLQGKWTVSDGDDEDEMLDDVVVVIEGKSVTILVTKNNTKWATGTLVLDPSKSPKHLDLTITGGSVTEESKRTKAKAIYELVDDKVTVCISSPDKRPAKYSTGGELQTVFLMLHRKKK